MLITKKFTRSLSNFPTRYEVEDDAPDEEEPIAKKFVSFYSQGGNNSFDVHRFVPQIA
jgi:hypothetical protein